MKIDTILFPTDFSDDANAALTHALFLAERHDAELHVLHVLVLHDYDPRDPDERFPEGEEILARLQQIATSELADLAQGRKDRLRIQEAQVHGVSAADEIVEYVGEHDVDVVVMGTHGRRGLRHALLGSTAEEVVRRAPCPVITLRRTAGEAGIQAIERILVPTDFSEHARQALEAAAGLAREYGSTLELLHVVERPVYPQYYDPINVWAEDFSFPKLAQRIEEGAAALMAEIDPDVAYEVTVREGAAAHTIVARAEETGADLAVIATHGLTGLERFLLGSVAEKVVRQAPCPVLTIKADVEEED